MGLSKMTPAASSDTTRDQKINQNIPHERHNTTSANKTKQILQADTTILALCITESDGTSEH
jgi:hypothetical protein